MTTLTDTKKKLLLLAAFFLIPLAIAFTWYYILPSSFAPRSINNGNLVQPVYPVQDFSHKTLANEAFTGKDLETVWTLVHIINNKCEEACSKALYNTRQMRIAFGKNTDRVNRITLANPAALSSTDPKMWQSHPDMKVLETGVEGGLDVQIKAQTTQQQYPEGSIYLIDPLGNLMMQFNPDLPTKKMMKDIKKLLKLSHIG